MNIPEVVTQTPRSDEADQVRAYAIAGLPNRWKCPNGHTLGLVLKEKIGGKVITYLCKFPFALADREYMPENIIVSKIHSGVIGCTICGATREWAEEKTGKKAK